MIGIELDIFKPVELLLKRREEKKHFERLIRALRDCALNLTTVHLQELAHLLSDPDNFKKPGVAYFYHKWIKENPMLLVSPTVHPLYGTVGQPVGYWTSSKKLELMKDLAAINW